jgi:hypothetical protein
VTTRPAFRGTLNASFIGQNIKWTTLNNLTPKISHANQSSHRRHFKFVPQHYSSTGSREVIMASTRRTTTLQSQPFVKHLKNPRALHSQNDLCLVLRTNLSHSLCHKVKDTLPNSPHENMKTGLPNCHHRNLAGFSNTRHIPKTKSSSSLNHNIKRNSSSFQYHTVVQEHRRALPKLSLQTASSQLHLRLNTSKDLRELRVDGSPFQVM